jgi:chemosensory pili system protein ChpA (sensor histidine kinase/response regulator)
MFAPGLSTADKAGVIAGHGIGLDSVSTAIHRLRGTITAQSEQGRGTIFRIRVPISHSITRAVHVRAANGEYAIPISAIRQMFSQSESGILVSLPDSEPQSPQSHAARFHRRVRIARSAPEQPLRLPDDPTAALYDEVPAFSLAELLGYAEQPRTTHMALLVETGQRQAVILVDEVLDESEVVIRALPAHLRRRAVRGASIMLDGRLFLVLDVLDLLSDALGGKTASEPHSQPVPQQPRQRAQQVLVVDDSISMRRALEIPLASAGYDVRLARDGVEALGMMIAELPDIMILDIEMPRLDGFELLSVINGNAALARVPVVILTSRAAEKHHRQAIELGARAYLTKPCPDDVLITTLRRVLREPRQDP